MEVESIPQAKAGAAKVEKIVDEESKKMVAALAMRPVMKAASSRVWM